MTQSSIFGTDGVRGRFGEPPVDAATLARLGWALGDLARSQPAPSLWVLGGDTRVSTPQVAAWVEAGLAATGARIAAAGVVPTPAVATLVRELGAAGGVSISASHNPWHDNGIKLFDRRGLKWSREEEARLERHLAAAPDPASLLEPAAAAGRGDAPGEAGGAATVGVPPDPGLGERYLSRLLATLPRADALSGLRIAIDAANGAASPWAERLFAGAGAEVVASHCRPDGRNINVDCGSTSPAEIARLVREGGCDLGAAFDGDADRCLIADERGRVLDGDALLFLLARDLRARGELDPAVVVVTEMSNLGLDAALAREGIAVERCGVGDREVVAGMLRRGARLGGEQSGHLIDLTLGSTGDGLLSALQVAALVARAGAPLSALATPFETFPQTLHNVPVRRKERFEAIPGLDAVLASVRGRLGAEGRVLLRYSGTEPLARVMIEGRDSAAIEAMASEIAATIERHLS